VHVVRELNQVLRARRDLYSEGLQHGDGEHAVSAEHVAARLGRSVAEVAQLLQLAEHPASLDAPLGHEPGESLLDSVIDEQAADPLGQRLSHERDDLLASGLSELSGREREVLAGRFGLSDREPETLETLAARLRLTRERVRQIQQEALGKLRRRMTQRGIDRDALF
jgi:RNA polymerase nonessential primary-like sigma factor